MWGKVNSHFCDFCCTLLLFLIMDRGSSFLFHGCVTVVWNMLTHYIMPLCVFSSRLHAWCQDCFHGDIIDQGCHNPPVAIKTWGGNLDIWLFTFSLSLKSVFLSPCHILSFALFHTLSPFPFTPSLSLCFSFCLLSLTTSLQVSSSFLYYPSFTCYLISAFIFIISSLSC